MIEQTYRIDMIPDGAPVVVHVSQYDTAARRLSFELYNGGVAYELPAGAVASIAGTKPDNTSFLYAMTVSGNLVSIDLQQQMALVAGDVPAEIQITGAEGKIGSANFIIRVERGPIDENSVISETDLPIFEQLVSDAQAAAADAQTAANTASAAASSVASIVPASPGSAGQVLTKTANGADWANIGCPFPVGFGGFFQTDPNSIYSGTKWEQKKDVFILAAGDTYKAGSTGGEAEHKLTQAEMPDYKIGFLPSIVPENHTKYDNGGVSGAGVSSDNVGVVAASGNRVKPIGYQYGWDINSNGGSQPHNNMPPYFAMPFWIRTA